MVGAPPARRLFVCRTRLVSDRPRRVARGRVQGDRVVRQGPVRRNPNVGLLWHLELAQRSDTHRGAGGHRSLARTRPHAVSWRRDRGLANHRSAGARRARQRVGRRNAGIRDRRPGRPMAVVAESVRRRVARARRPAARRRTRTGIALERGRHRTRARRAPARTPPARRWRHRRERVRPPGDLRGRGSAPMDACRAMAGSCRTRGVRRRRARAERASQCGFPRADRCRRRRSRVARDVRHTARGRRPWASRWTECGQLRLGARIRNGCGVRVRRAGAACGCGARRAGVTASGVPTPSRRRARDPTRSRGSSAACSNRRAA